MVRLGVVAQVAYLVSLLTASQGWVAPSAKTLQRELHLQSSATLRESRRGGARTLVAKRMGPGGRKEYERMLEMQRQMAAAKKETEGIPVFQIFAGPKEVNGLWYPVAGFRGDGMSKSIVDNYIGEGFINNMMRDVYKQQIEAAVSKTVFEQEKKLVEAGYAMHQSMKGISRDRMKWGYKITYKPLETKMGRQEVTELKPEMARSIFEKFKDNFQKQVNEAFSLTEQTPIDSTPAPAPKAKKGKKKREQGASGAGETKA